MHLEHPGERTVHRTGWPRFRKTRWMQSHVSLAESRAGFGRPPHGLAWDRRRWWMPGWRQVTGCNSGTSRRGSPWRSVIQIVGRESLGGHHRRPPLITHHGNVHRVKQFERHVGLHDGVRLLLFKYVRAQFSKPGLLMGSGASGTLQLLFSHMDQPGARLSTNVPISSEDSSRSIKWGIMRASSDARQRG